MIWLQLMCNARKWGSTLDCCVASQLLQDPTRWRSVLVSVDVWAIFDSLCIWMDSRREMEFEWKGLLSRQANARHCSLVSICLIHMGQTKIDYAMHCNRIFCTDSIWFDLAFESFSLSFGNIFNRDRAYHIFSVAVLVAFVNFCQYVQFTHSSSRSNSHKLAYMLALRINRRLSACKRNQIGWYTQTRTAPMTTFCTLFLCFQWHLLSGIVSV